MKNFIKVRIYCVFSHIIIPRDFTPWKAFSKNSIPIYWKTPSRPFIQLAITPTNFGKQRPEVLKWHQHNRLVIKGLSDHAGWRRGSQQFRKGKAPGWKRVLAIIPNWWAKVLASSWAEREVTSSPLFPVLLVARVYLASYQNHVWWKKEVETTSVEQIRHLEKLLILWGCSTKKKKK